MGSIRSKIVRAPFTLSGWRELSAGVLAGSNVAADLSIQAADWQELAAALAFTSAVVVDVSTAQWQELQAAAAAASGVVADLSVLPATSILFGGDSLGMGFNSTNTLGLRGDLSWYLSLLGANIDFIGPNSTGGSNLPDPDHCAQSGASTGTILTNFQNYINANATVAPRWIVTDGGINNVANNGENAATASSSVDTMLRGMLTLARTRNPAAQIIWQNAFNLPPGDPQEALIAPFNSAMVTKIAAINSEFGANSVRLFDANTALGAYDTTNMGGDRLHPAEAGWAIVRGAFISQYRLLFRNTGNAINALSVAITSPTAGATWTVGVPATISGTVSRPKQDVTVTPIKGGADQASATVQQYAGSFSGPVPWSTSYTPVSGDIGSIVLGARVDDIVDSTSALAATVTVTVQAAAPSHPLSIISTRTNLLFVRADSGVVESGGAGTGVTQWQDQSGSAQHFAQSGAASLRPTFVASSANFNNKPTLLLDGADDYMVSPINLPAPGTTPLWFWMIFRLATWTSGRPIFGQNSTNCYVRPIVATPQLFASWGTLSAANSGAGSNRSVAARLKMLLNNAATDYLRIGPTNVTGTNLGNTDAPVNLGLGAYANGTSPSNIEVAEFGIWSGGEPSASELSNMEAYATSRYGVGLLV